MKGGLFASYEKIRIYSSSTFNLSGAVCLGGGVGTVVRQKVKTVSLRNFLDPPNTDFYRYTVGIDIFIDYMNPEPLFGEPYKTILFFHYFDNILHSVDLRSQNSNIIPSYINMEFILIKPKFFFIKDGNYFKSYLIADGYNLNISSDVQGINFSQQSNNKIIVSKYCTNPSEFIFLGGGLYGQSSANVSVKGGCNTTINSSASIQYGIQYMFEGEDFYRSLPIKIDYLTHNLIVYPSISGSNTSNVSITSPCFYYQNNTENKTVNTTVGLQIIPNRKRKIKRFYDNDNKVLVYRGTHPRLCKMKRWWNYTNTSNNFNVEKVELNKKCGQLITVLDENENVLETEVFDYEFNSPYYISVYQGESWGNVYDIKDYSSMTFFENTGFPNIPFAVDLDGQNHRDTNNPIFAHLFSPSISTVYFSSGPFEYELYGSHINNLYSFWNWCLYFPPDEDNQNWFAPVFGNMVQPEKIYNNEYWGLVREQWLEHTRLPQTLRSKLRNYIKDSPLYHSDLSERIVRYWNLYANNHNPGNFPDFEWNVYTPDEFRSGNLFCYLGFWKTKIYKKQFANPEIKIANSIQKYVFENCSGSSSTNFINITPNSNNIKIKYSLGSFSVSPYLFDILANKFKYKIVGNNVQNIKVIFKSFSGQQKEIYSGSLLEQTLPKNVSFGEEKWASSAVQDYSGNISVVNIDKGIEIDTDNVSNAVFSDNRKVINYSLFSSCNISEIEFEIQLSNTSSFQFYWLEFIYEPKNYWHIIENANHDVFVNPDFYFRYGNLDFYDEQSELIRNVPLVRKPTYRMSLLDGICFSRLFFECQNNTEALIKDWLDNKFEKYELYSFYIDFDGDIIFENENKITEADFDTYFFPIFYNDRKTKNNEIEFAYGTYYYMLPPISTLPQYCFRQDNLENEYVWIYTPSKRNLWNYKKQLRLYKVFYNTSNQETNRITYSLPDNDYNIPNVHVEKYNIVGGYQNDEYIKDFTGSVVNSPRYIVGDGEKDLSRITPFHGHTYNYFIQTEQPPVVNFVVYRCWQDINENEKIYLLGYSIQNQEYVYGYYNIKTKEIILLPKQERSIDFTFINDQSYLEYVDEIGTSATENRYEYRLIYNNQEIKRIRIKGRRPSVVFDFDKVIIASRDDRYGGHYVQYFESILSDIRGNANLIVANLSDIDNLPYPYAEAISVLDKREKIYVHAYHWFNPVTNKKNVGIRFFNVSEGYYIPEFENHVLYFSDVFSNQNISYSHPYISELNDGIIIWATGSDNKIYGIKLNHNYRAGMSYEKTTISVVDELLEYHTPCVYTVMHGGIMFVNTVEGIKVINLDEGMQRIGV